MWKLLVVTIFLAFVLTACSSSSEGFPDLQLPQVFIWDNGNWDSENWEE